MKYGAYVKCVCTGGICVMMVKIALTVKNRIMTKEMFQEITEWQNKTFPASTSLSKVHHLKKELEELQYDIEQNFPTSKALEFADCFILLMGAAASDGMSYEDVCDVINRKMQINKLRKWGTPDKNGVVLHIKEKEVGGVYKLGELQPGDVFTYITEDEMEYRVFGFISNGNVYIDWRPRGKTGWIETSAVLLPGYDVLYLGNEPIQNKKK